MLTGFKESFQIAILATLTFYSIGFVGKLLGEAITGLLRRKVM